MSNGIEGKVIVITGASSGLGAAAARLLAEKGALLVLGARRIDRINALAKELLESTGKQAIAVQVDVTDKNQVRDLVDSAIENFGRIDVMLNNAWPHAPFAFGSI